VKDSLHCPSACLKSLVLPESRYGLSLNQVYCPKCEEVYVPRNKIIDIDGAYFSCSFPHIFFQTFAELLPQQKPVKYAPKIYGFKIFGKKCSKFEGKTPEEVFGESKKPLD
jgi:casein kinase II subunit beta